MEITFSFSCWFVCEMREIRNVKWEMEEQETWQHRRLSMQFYHIWLKTKKFIYFLAHLLTISKVDEIFSLPTQQLNLQFDHRNSKLINCAEYSIFFIIATIFTTYEFDEKCEKNYFAAYTDPAVQILLNIF